VGVVIAAMLLASSSVLSGLGSRANQVHHRTRLNPYLVDPIESGV
jgi:hypothetical protein